MKVEAPLMKAIVDAYSSPHGKSVLPDNYLKKP
jgi:hypothetical protein